MTRTLHHRSRRGPWASFAVALVAALAVAPRAASASAWSVSAAPSDATATAAPLLQRVHAERFALVIGSNHSLDRKQAPLRYADDDAAKLASVLVEAGVDVELLTTLDHDSQASFPDVVGRTTPATAAGLRDRSAALVERMAAAKAGGAVVELVLYYSGHGDVGPDGQGYLTLDDGKFTRADLFGKILATSPADHNHILIDACRSEQFVLSRGRNRWKSDQAEGGYGEAVRKYLDAHQLGAFPNTGVILAHSVDQQTHEWERYRGGIFTHELVSGLRGGADLNGDGHIEYSELGAFVSAANSSVDDARARLQVVVRPPADDERHPVLVHPALLGTRALLMTDAVADLWSIEDAHGVRVADLRRSGERPGYLRLPEGELFVTRERPGDDGTVREETTIPADRGGVILGASLAFAASTQQAKGALDRALRAGLFATPFGPGYYAGYTDRTGLLAVRDPKWREREWEAALAADAAKSGEALPAATPPAPLPIETPEPAVKPAEKPSPIAAALDRRAKMRPWGGIGVGTILTPFRGAGDVAVEGAKRVTANDFAGAFPEHPSRAPALRGFDLRWQLFSVDPDRKYPRWLGYFRTGYTAGFADFSRSSAPTAGQATALSYLTVPLFLGGNFYPFFSKFPLRPYLGLAAGLDILRVSYRRHEQRALVDVSARIGFDLHAGLEVRITNYVAITAEILQLWSARRRLDGVPDFSNEGFSILTGVAVAMPLRRNSR